MGAFFFVRYILLFIFDHHITIVGLLIPEVPLFLLLGTLYILSKRIVYSLPFSRKEYLSVKEYSSGRIVNHNMKSGFITFAGIFASGSSKPVHTVIIRMILYVLKGSMGYTLFTIGRNYSQHSCCSAASMVDRTTGESDTTCSTGFTYE